jgi:hypothetical protein
MEAIRHPGVASVQIIYNRFANAPRMPSLPQPKLPMWP